ncbi:MAG TPA: hypothetical protein VFR94_03805 [Nitrososphaeraceae archaeon]|nr:hypothetical protein [Nitrososphaeraceae archaeon]
MLTSDLIRCHSGAKLALISLVIGTLGAFLQIGGTSWDVTSHLMLEPETFFTPSHTVLYSGIGLLVLSAGIGGFVLFRNKEIGGKSYTVAFKLLIVGSAVSLIAGPSDFLWHEEFGVDGLLSPPHLALITGMLTNSIAVVVGLVRIQRTQLTHPKETIVRLAIIPAFAALWFTTTWYVYMFSLPFSNGENFQFNPNPTIAVLVATISLPLLNSIILLAAQKTIGGFGGATAVAVLVVTLNILTNVIPTVQPIVSFLPWYLVAAILPALIADLAINYLPRITKISMKNSQLISGAIIGSLFYIFSYPMITWIYSIPFGMNFASMEGIEAIGNLAYDFQNSLMSILAFTVVPGAIIGMLGAILILDKTHSPIGKVRNQASSANMGESYPPEI